jgi:hypothetical protein
MELGFETIGNATLIVHDDGPVLVTDPWIDGAPYFGSWTHSHEIPEQQRADIQAARYVWISHGHPDHLDAESLARLGDRPILLPTHVGQRIKNDLEAEGHPVRELPTAEWVPLSERVRVMCLPDYNQDACLLVDVDGDLIIDANDSSARGWLHRIRKEAAGRKRVFLMKLTGYGDPEMINFFDESGSRIEPPAMRRKREGEAVGPVASRFASAFGATHFIPFSFMHTYQREDSAWANDCTTPLGACSLDFDTDGCTLLPPFVHYDLKTDACHGIEPAPREVRIRPPSDFGDDWSQPLEREDVEQATRYFQSIEHLKRCVDYVNLRVGGEDHVIQIGSKPYERGVTFECPRNSLVTTLQYQIFDDLLIGNFMKTTLHGPWPSSGLYPDFTPYVAKYADNGHARSEAELRAYFREYRRRTGSFDFLRERLIEVSANRFRAWFEMDSEVYRFARRAYWLVRRAS